MSEPRERPVAARELPPPRPSLASLPAYAPEAAPGTIDLSDNTNLFGVPPAAMRMLHGADAAWISRYPTPYADALRRAIAEYHAVPIECVITGCGSDGVLDAAIRTFSQPHDRIAYHDPTFSMVAALARVNALEAIAVPCAGAPDATTVRAMFASQPRLAYLCSPNNPTGAAATPDACNAARECLRAASPPPLLVFDQAYAEFEEPDGVPRRRFTHEEPVLVVRTLSKAFGLAGLRVGYGIGPAAVVREIEKARGPYTVGGPSERAAVAALTLDREWVRARAAEVPPLRERFADALRTVGFVPLPSAANFVFVPVRSAPAAAATLRRAGISVRAFSGLAAIGDGIRITIGPWPMLEACLAALREVQP